MTKHRREYYIFSAVDRVQIAAAYSAGLHLNANLATSGFSQVDFFNTKNPTSPFYDCCTRFHSVRLPLQRIGPG